MPAITSITRTESLDDQAIRSSVFARDLAAAHRALGARVSARREHENLATPSRVGTLPGMQPECEVCMSFRPEAERDPARQFVEVVFDTRAVLLCRGHARIAERSGVTSFEQLREYYGSGRRSFVPRRGRDGTQGPDERRTTPGRRATDPGPA